MNQNPLKNLFAGCGPAVLGIIPYMGINFALYDYLVRRNERTKVGDAGAAGAIAGKMLLKFFSIQGFESLMNLFLVMLIKSL